MKAIWACGAIVVKEVGREGGKDRSILIIQDRSGRILTDIVITSAHPMTARFQQVSRQFFLQQRSF